jgi:CDP-diacylglycerol--glycerol-3-phosphate 3-phosphatidyltransferase
MMTFANKLSIFRILSVPFFVATLIYYNSEREILRWAALGIFCLAALSDLLDGFIARKLKQRTVLGSIIDPLADKILLITAFVALASLKSFPPGLEIPTWVPIIVISRDAIIFLGVILIYTLKKEIEILPTMLGKLTTFFQMLTIIVVIAHFDFAPYVWTLAIIFTLTSGIQYIARGTKILNEENKNC